MTTATATAPPVRKPPKPLPRIARSAPLTVEEAERQEAAVESEARAARAQRRERRAASPPADAEEGETRVLREATPRFDTVETRQRVRIALAAVAGLAVLLAAFLVIRAIGGGGRSQEVMVIDEAEMFGPTIARATDGETIGRDLIKRARTAPDIKVAHSQLQRVVDDYPRTHVAQEARVALDRLARGLPPFPDVPGLTPAVPAVAAAPLTPDPAVAAPVAVAPAPAATAPVPVPVVAAPAPVPEPDPQPVVRVLPPDFAAAPDAVEDPSGWPSRIVSGRDGATMVLIPGGLYVVGRDDGVPAEGPAHRVELPPYYLDEHEVTVGQFAAYREAMIARGESVSPTAEELTRLGLSPRHPVVLVSAEEALRYAAWAGKALPTEAQWEAAARGPEGLIHPWGAGPAPWSDSRRPRSVDPVMLHEADRSPAGVCDLAANAWEWTADYYDADHYRLLAGRVSYNPGGPSLPGGGVPSQTVRGSSPTYEASYRAGMPATTRYPYLGFRCALNVEGLPLPSDLPPPPPAGQPAATPTPAPTHPAPGQPAAPSAPAGQRPGVLVPF